MRTRLPAAWGLIAAAVVCGRTATAQELEPEQLERIVHALREEGEAVVALADGLGVRDDLTGFSLSWRNDFLKAQSGTFVPFVVEIDSVRRRPAAALLYVRLAARSARPIDRHAGASPEVVSESPVFPVEEIFPVDLTTPRDGPVRVARGFAVAPGDYDVTVVVRERDRGRDRRRMAGVLRRPLRVPDYGGTELSTSTVMLADDVVALSSPVPPRDLAGRPYAVGLREITPAADAVLRRHEELIVVFLIYNPTLTLDEHFDLQVEYHFFRKTGTGSTGGAKSPAQVPAALPGEMYVNRTEPQRFNPVVLGASFDPAAGQPIMAGQGIPLERFEQGDYRLAITVKDLVSGRSIERQMTFTVRS